LLRGGLEIVFLRLAAEFARRGLKVWLVVHDCDGGMVPAVPPEVELVNLDVSSKPWTILRLHRFLRQTHPDILLAPEPYGNVVSVIARWLAGSQTRLVLTEHTPVDHNLERSVKWRRHIWRGLIKCFYAQADAVVSVSEGIRDDLLALRLPSHLLRVVYNPALDPDFEAVGQRSVDHPWFHDPSLPIIIGVGRLSAEKDFATLIRAFARLRRERPVRLVIAGEGDQEIAIKELIAELDLIEDVWLPGFRLDVCALITKSSVLVSASRYEGFGITMVEALGCGCPVVATQTVGAVEILEGGRYGHIVPVGDVEAMMGAIAATLADPPDPAPGRERAAMFSTERSSNAYLDLFAELCT
jgi:glycosyltransferase involved in cell wall biosynthesis